MRPPAACRSAGRERARRAPRTSPPITRSSSIRTASRAPAFAGVTDSQAVPAGGDSRQQSVEAPLSRQHVAAIVTAADKPEWATDLVFGDHFIGGTSGIAAAGGYPIAQVPAGNVFGVPIGISFFGTAFSEPTLIKLASGYEAFRHARADNLPTFALTIPFDHIAGTSPSSRAAAASSAPAKAAASVRSAPGPRMPHGL